MDKEIIASLSYRIKQLESQCSNLEKCLYDTNKKIDLLQVNNQAIFCELQQLRNEE